MAISAEDAWKERALKAEARLASLTTVSEQDVERVVNDIVRAAGDYDGLHPYTSLSYTDCCVLVRAALTAFVEKPQP